MPYIKPQKRAWLLDKYEDPENAGELNFLITAVVIEYLLMNKESYQSYNDALGALEGAKLELYRRKIAPYEDKKIVENGDVYYVQKAGN